MNNFQNFVNKKSKVTRRQLGILEKVLKLGGFSTRSFIESENPYIFIKSTDDKLSFGGIRMYKIGEHIAFRVQNAESTHPYGKAYSIPVEELYNDIVSEEANEEHAAQEVMKSISQEIRNFFKKNVAASSEIKSFEISDSNGGRVGINNQGFNADNSNLITNNKF